MSKPKFRLGQVVVIKSTGRFAAVEKVWWPSLPAGHAKLDNNPMYDFDSPFDYPYERHHQSNLRKLTKREMGI